MSAMLTWQESEWVSLPMLQTCRSCTSLTPGMARIHGFDALQLHAAGSAFQQDVQALADDADGRPEDHDADADGERGIDPALAGEGDGDATGDHRGRGQRVADFVHDGAAQVDVAMAAHEQQGDAAVHQHSGGGDPDHELRLARRPGSAAGGRLRTRCRTRSGRA